MVEKLYKKLYSPLVENIGGIGDSGGVQPMPPQPIQYLTAWRLIGNSEVKTLPYSDGVVLPSGYKRCEYLQGDGTAYIEVPFGFYKTDEVYAKAAMLEFNADTYFVTSKTWKDANNRWAMGVHRINIDGTWIIVFANAYGVQGTAGAGLQPYIVADNVAREWEYKNYICSMGGSVKDNSDITFGSETQNLRLFFGYNTPTQCQIYEYRHKKGNAEYRLIPCLDSNDTPCMYDVINSQAYYNSAGSGSFTYKLYPQPKEIWSCGEYSATDGKYHIVVLPLGKSPVDIALTEPLRKVNDVADTIEFPSTTEGKAVVTRNIASVWIKDIANITMVSTTVSNAYRFKIITNAKGTPDQDTVANILCNKYSTVTGNQVYTAHTGIADYTSGNVYIYDEEHNATVEDFKAANANTEVIYELATPTTELVDAPQIEVSATDTYTQIISQGAKAVAWSSFETE